MAEEITQLWDKLCLIESKKSELLVVGDGIHSTFECGKCCLIGKKMAKKRINYEAFKNTMLKCWKTGAAINIVEVGMNTFILKFASDGVLYHVWDGQSWLFD